jgi:hypothetical protein
MAGAGRLDYVLNAKCDEKETYPVALLQLNNATYRILLVIDHCILVNGVRTIY